MKTDEFTVKLTEKEYQAILDICRAKDMSFQGVFIQALRTYQLANLIFEKTGKHPLETDLDFNSRADALTRRINDATI